MGYGMGLAIRGFEDFDKSVKAAVSTLVPIAPFAPIPTLRANLAELAVVSDMTAKTFGTGIDETTKMISTMAISGLRMRDHADIQGRLTEETRDTIGRLSLLSERSTAAGIGFDKISSQILSYMSTQGVGIEVMDGYNVLTKAISMSLEDLKKDTEAQSLTFRSLQIASETLASQLMNQSTPELMAWATAIESGTGDYWETQKKVAELMKDPVQILFGMTKAFSGNMGDLAIYISSKFHLAGESAEALKGILEKIPSGAGIEEIRRNIAADTELHRIFGENTEKTMAFMELVKNPMELIAIQIANIARMLASALSGPLGRLAGKMEERPITTLQQAAEATAQGGKIISPEAVTRF